MISFQLNNGESIISLNIPIEANSKKENPEDKKSRKFNVSNLELSLDPGTSTYLLEYQFTDADGETFLASGGKLEPKKPKEGEEEVNPFVSKSIPLSSLIPSAENLVATVDYPIALTQLKAKNVEDPLTPTSLLILGEVKLNYEKFKIINLEEGSSWMALLTESVTKWAKISIELAIGLIGLMMFWLGLMRIAEKAGLVQIIANMLKPIMVFLFPGINPKGEAMGAIVMNVAANMLGLGNAATPLGIKAMKELQKENKYKEYASNAQCMLLAINTSSVTLIPVTVIAFRGALNAENLLSFWPVMVMATIISSVCAVIATKVLEKISVFQVPADALLNDDQNPSEEASS